MAAIQILLLIFVCGLLGFLALKIRRIHLKQFELQARLDAGLDNSFAQFEALMALTHELQLTRALQATRGWAGSPDFLLQAFRIALEEKPEVIVECSSGVSTVVLARAAQLNGRGHVWSLEHDAVFAAKTRKELARHDLESWATVVDAPLVQRRLNEGAWRWYAFDNFPAAPIQMLVIDGPPQSTQQLARFPAVPVLRDLLAPGAAILVDDAARPDETEMVRRWVDKHRVQRTGESFAEKGLVVLRAI